MDLQESYFPESHSGKGKGGFLVPSRGEMCLSTKISHSSCNIFRALWKKDWSPDTDGPVHSRPKSCTPLRGPSFSSELSLLLLLSTGLCLISCSRTQKPSAHCRYRHRSQYLLLSFGSKSWLLSSPNRLSLATPPTIN